jgi:hypothetical protein
MKRSELKTTGETYRMTPDGWGNESYIMIDEDLAAKAAQEAFNLDEPPDPDEGQRPQDVEVFTDDNGKFFAVIDPIYDRDYDGKKRMVQDYMYTECQNPLEARDGTAEMYGEWQLFDDEED